RLRPRRGWHERGLRLLRHHDDLSWRSRFAAVAPISVTEVRAWKTPPPAPRSISGGKSGTLRTQTGDKTVPAVRVSPMGRTHRTAAGRMRGSAAAVARRATTLSHRA